MGPCTLHRYLDDSIGKPEAADVMMASLEGFISVLLNPLILDLARLLEYSEQDQRWRTSFAKPHLDKSSDG